MCYDIKLISLSWIFFSKYYWIRPYILKTFKLRVEDMRSILIYSKDYLGKYG